MLFVLLILNCTKASDMVGSHDVFYDVYGSMYVFYFQNAEFDALFIQKFSKITTQTYFQGDQPYLALL